ncbi:MAG: Crp/Fnr family transcriptional regulator [Sphingobacteriales bacterium JAD_PAG50586_3]|nr:MAG: Crp/Fnr family transcriptional regulator [Sphingobacteriales bacterium JAD_PAG50586_3]
MIDLSKLSEYLQLFKELSLEDAKFFFTLTRQRHLKAGELYVQAGEMHRKVAHVKSGLMRAYIIDENGEEATLFFRKEDQQVAPYDCIFADKPSRMFLEAFENTTLIEVDYDKLQEFMHRHPQYEKARKHFHQKLLMESFLRLENFILYPPLQRYQKFVKEQPDLAQRVPDKYLDQYFRYYPGLFKPHTQAHKTKGQKLTIVNF